MNMKKYLFIILAIIILVILAGVVYVFVNRNTTNTNNTNQPPAQQNETKTPALLLPPISSASERVTKKPFGIKISPTNSPVSPERFTGYHTGVDFEILIGEENIDVPISAICSGKLLLKKWGSGYGGYAVQACKLENQDITVVYGHLKLSGIEINVGDEVLAGQKIGILGKGYSTETDGERKHLHLGVHKGATINSRGYVATSLELENWIDVTKYLK
jgi:murein DD-endopeptidase MepM/ murein hydrolase activator NlpD